MSMKIPHSARKKDNRTRDFPLTPAISKAPLHSGGRRPPAPAKMPKVKR